MLLLFALACEPDPLPALNLPPADLSVRVEDKAVDSGEPVVVVVDLQLATGWTLEPPRLGAQGLTLTEVDRAGPTALEGRSRTTLTLHATGADGSYILAAPGPVTASGPNGETRELSVLPVFVDIGVKGPTGGALADFESAPPPAPPPWPWIAAGLGAIGLLTAGAFWWRRRARAPLPLPLPDPAHLVARKAWASARAASLDDHSQALRLSLVLRSYLDPTLRWPATTATTRELLAHIAATEALPEAEQAAASRILEATDRVKFAREGGGEAFFAALDDDFEAILRATEPRPEAPSAPVSPPPQG